MMFMNAPRAPAACALLAQFAATSLRALELNEQAVNPAVGPLLAINLGGAPRACSVVGQKPGEIAEIGGEDELTFSFDILRAGSDVGPVWHGLHDFCIEGKNYMVSKALPFVLRLGHTDAGPVRRSKLLSALIVLSLLRREEGNGNPPIQKRLQRLLL